MNGFENIDFSPLKDPLMRCYIEEYVRGFDFRGVALDTTIAGFDFKPIYNDFLDINYVLVSFEDQLIFYPLVSKNYLIKCRNDYIDQEKYGFLVKNLEYESRSLNKIFMNVLNPELKKAIIDYLYVRVLSYCNGCDYPLETHELSSKEYGKLKESASKYFSRSDSLRKADHVIYSVEELGFVDVHVESDGVGVRIFSITDETSIKHVSLDVNPEFDLRNICF